MLGYAGVHDLNSAGHKVEIFRAFHSLARTGKRAEEAKTEFIVEEPQLLNKSTAR